MKPSLLFTVLLLIPPVASFYGYLFLIQSVEKTSKKYRTFTLSLKKQGGYENWAHQNKYLVLFDKVYKYTKASFFVAILIGFVIKFVSMPKLAVTILEITVYIYWPIVFIFMIILSKLYKKIPELQT